MAFQIRRRNEVKDETVTAPQTYTTGEEAFRAAMANVVTFITNHWDGTGVNGPDGPSNDYRFKIYIERRPGKAEVELRYSYPILEPDPDPEAEPGTMIVVDHETNSIYWRVLEV